MLLAARGHQETARTVGGLPPHRTERYRDRVATVAVVVGQPNEASSGRRAGYSSPRPRPSVPPVTRAFAQMQASAKTSDTLGNATFGRTRADDRRAACAHLRNAPMSAGAQTAAPTRRERRRRPYDRLQLVEWAASSLSPRAQGTLGSSAMEHQRRAAAHGALLTSRDANAYASTGMTLSCWREAGTRPTTAVVGAGRQGTAEDWRRAARPSTPAKSR